MKSRGHQKRKGGIKVTYISSPMKVKTSASNFRALVQELTGKCSNVAEPEAFMAEAREWNNDDLIMKGSSSSSSSPSLSLSLLEQQWRVVGPEPEEEQEAAAWLKLLDSSSLMEPRFNQQLELDILSFDVL